MHTELSLLLIRLQTWARGSRDKKTKNFNLVTRRWLVSFTPRPLYSRKKDLRYQVQRRLMGLRDGLDAVQKREISCTCPEISPDPLVIQFLAKSQYRLSYRSMIWQCSLDPCDSRQETAVGCSWQQSGKCTCNGTMRRVRATIAAVQKQ
jgi:hypothetical protein